MAEFSANEFTKYNFNNGQEISNKTILGKDDIMSLASGLAWITEQYNAFVESVMPQLVQKLDKNTTPTYDGEISVYAVDELGEQVNVRAASSPFEQAKIPLYDSFGKVYVSNFQQIPNAGESDALKVVNANDAYQIAERKYDEKTASLEVEVAWLKNVVQDNFVTMNTYTDTFVTRKTETPDGKVIISNVETEVISVQGNTVASTNYLASSSSYKEWLALANGTVETKRNGDGSYSISIGTTESTSARFAWVVCEEETTALNKAPVLLANQTYYFHLRNTDFDSSISIRAGFSQYPTSQPDAAFTYKRLDTKNQIITFTPTSDVVVNYLEFRIDANASNLQMSFDFKPSIELVGGETEYVAPFNGLKNATFVGITSINKDDTAEDTSFFLASSIELGKWDKLNVESQQIERCTVEFDAGTHEYTDIGTTDNGIVWAQFYLSDTANGKGVTGTGILTDDYLDDDYLNSTTDKTMRICTKTLGNYVRMVVGNVSDISTGVTATKEEVISYLTANDVKIAYQRATAETMEVTVPTSYVAYNGGTETVEGNGIPVTVTQKFLVKV